MISLIAAISEDRALGKNNQLIWKLSKDLQRFKAITSGHPVIMGRKTYESIGRALPNRFNIVISANPEYKLADATISDSLPAAIELAKGQPGSDEIFILGGGQIFQQAISLADKLYLTIIHAQADADVFFPEYAEIFKKETFRQDDEENGIKFTYLNLEK